MKKYIIIMICLFCFVGFAQQKSLYTNEVYKKPTEFDSTIVFVSFKKSMYGLTFSKETPEDVKPLIKRFMKTKQGNYTALGDYTIKLIKKNDNYYLVENEKPKKLILLN